MKKKSMIRKIINLSPLVDVFMIIIFWYIMFSNQNLQNQEENAQNVIGGLQQENEALKDRVERLELENEFLDEKLAGESENAQALEAETEKLKNLLEQDGQFLILRLIEGLEDLRILEATHGKDTERITFASDERPAMQEKLKAIVLKYLGDKSKLSVLFLYGGDNSYARDVLAIEEILEKIQKEEYFVYTKINLDR